MIYFTLLENDYTQMPNNKNGIIDYLKGLYALKIAVNKAKDNFVIFSKNMQQLKGVERTLKQTITFIEEDFKSYGDWTTQVTAGIDRIINRSKIIIGEIKFD